MTTRTMKSTCDGLRLWYQQTGQSYPTDDAGRGLFTQWFEEGGFEEPDMEEEFDEKLDCAYLDFAVNEDTDANEFPFPPEVVNESDEDKKLVQLRVIRHCWLYGTAPRNADNDWADKKAKEYNLDDIDYTAMASDKTSSAGTTGELLKDLKTRCPNLRERIGEPDLLNLTAIGQQHGLPLLIYLADCFVRARLAQHVEAKKKGHKISQVLTVSNWVASNPYLQRVAEKPKHGTKVTEKIASAIGAFGNRVAPLFQLDPSRPVVDDDLSEIVTCLNAAVAFIRDLPPNSYPLQFDFSIAVRGCSQPQLKKLALPFGGDDEEDDDDDEDEDDEKGDKSYFDVLQDIEDRLTLSGTRFEKRSVDGDIYTGKYPRLFSDVYMALKETHEIKEAGFPRGRRLCCLVDRRDKITQFAHYEAAHPGKDEFKKVNRRPTLQEPDEMYFYLPPSDCDRVDTQKGTIREVYFDRVKQCLIPNATYQKDKGESPHKGKVELTPKSQLMREAITSDSTCNGGLLTFSFQVDAKDAIACYLHWNGKCIRFLPEDVTVVLPLIFASTAANKKFAASNKATEVKYEDKQFQIFDEKVSAQ